MKALVLGSGMMGTAIAFDLLKREGSEVTLFDSRTAGLDLAADRFKKLKVRGNIDFRLGDVTNRDHCLKAMRGKDVTVSAVPYFFNESLAKLAVRAGTNFCDLGGNWLVVEKELSLHAKAKKAGVTIVPDCGLAPGLVNVLVAHGLRRFERVDEVHLRVGGLPQKPRPPLNYSLFFSPEGLINEYVEKVKVIRNGKVIELEPMAELETVELPPLGTLEAFLTSGGTSTLIDTLKGKVRELDYKTIRYPGHCEKFKFLIDLGLTSSESHDVGGMSVGPRQVLIKLLEQKLGWGKEDIVLVMATLIGTVQGERKTLRYDIIDYYDAKTGMTAMMRTTGYSTAIVAGMLADGIVETKGALPIETCVPPDIFMDELGKRSIRVEEKWDD